MTVETNTPTTRRDEVVQQLREEIVNGTLRPGEVIKDAELAARLGFSITPVREALAQLAMEGLIEMPPNRAKRVAPLSKRSAVELCVVMRVLSVTAYELGLPRLLFADLEAMRAVHATMVAAIERGDMPAARLASPTFHDIVIRAADNREMRRMLALLLARFERLLRLLVDAASMQDEITSQAAILDAIERRDLPAALAAYRESMERFQRAVEQMPDDL